MRRVLRHAFTILAAISLLLCLAVCVLWVRSYWTADVAGFTRNLPAAESRLIGSANGAITYRHLAHPAGSAARYMSPGWVYDHGPAAWKVDGVFGPNIRRFLGVTYSDNTWRTSGPLSGTREIALRVPYWLLLAATGALPIAGLLRGLKRRRAAREAAMRGHCPACGYDLRASPERCPECGTVVKG